MYRKSTGLKDINGNEIFVGDTVYFRNGEVCYIEIGDNEFKTLFYKEKGIVRERGDSDYYVMTDDNGFFAFSLDEYSIERYEVEIYGWGRE